MCGQETYSNFIWIEVLVEFDVKVERAGHFGFLWKIRGADC